MVKCLDYTGIATMVKLLDDISLIDHVGWRLWRLARLWKAGFEQAMAARRLQWCSGARAELVGALRQGPQPQSAMVVALGITKQAVQQIVDELAALGVVERQADPADARARLVVLTAKGRKALEESNAVKREIETRFRATLGARRFTQFMDDLDRLTQEIDPSDPA
jgi:DNA-binding MarR family transcriptional regulator